MQDEIAALLQKLDLSGEQISQLEKYVHLLETARLNVTSLSGDALWIRGILNSLEALRLFPTTTKLGADIGSGGGLPGVVLAIARPDMSWTFIDSRRRRMEFLTDVIHALNMDNVRLIHSRIEEALYNEDWNLRHQFDVVTARAVAPLRIVVELGLPLLSVNGRLVMLMGPQGKDLVEKQEGWIQSLGGESGPCLRSEVYNGDCDSGWVVAINKVSNTNHIYPRRGPHLGR